MQTLVIAATAKEIAPFIEHLWQNTTPPVDILITGIGLTATTNSLTRQFYINRPDLVIQAGIAGCFDKEISLGTVMYVIKDTIADQGVWENKKWLSVFDLGLASPRELPYQQGWLVNNNPVLSRIKMKKVRSISVNQLTTAGPTIEIYKRKFKPVLESMEGAALHYCCLVENIPFIQVRAVSNYAGERNKKNWKIPEAISNLNNELIHLINNL